MNTCLLFKCCFLHSTIHTIYCVPQIQNLGIYSHSSTQSDGASGCLHADCAEYDRRCLFWQICERCQPRACRRIQCRTTCPFDTAWKLSKQRIDFPAHCPKTESAPNKKEPEQAGADATGYTRLLFSSILSRNQIPIYPCICSSRNRHAVYYSEIQIVYGTMQFWDLILETQLHKIRLIIIF